MKANKRSLVSLLQPVFQPLHRENELSTAINSRSVSAVRQNFTLTESFLQSANNARCSRKYLARSGCRLRYALTCLQAMRQVTALPAILPYLSDTFNNFDRGVAVSRPDSACVSLVNAIATEKCSLQGHQEEEETRPATQENMHTYSVLLSEASRPAVT